MRIKLSIAAAAAILFFANCNEPSTTSDTHTATNTNTEVVSDVKPIELACHYLTGKDSIKKVKSTYGQHLDILMAINRTDSNNIEKMDTLLIPNNLSGTVNQYSPFPQTIPYGNVKKIILFSYPAQYFAAYENGRMVRSGQTNMGREKDPTPTGLFFTNWKAEETKSTFNDEWDLKWNFNIENKLGVGFHEYALPGYPASHSCLRLTQDDAKFLYTFAEEWKLKDKDEVRAKGTPVLVFGSYPFGSRKPWLQLAQNPHATDISPASIKQMIDEKLNDIMAAQATRDSLDKKSA